VRVLTGLAHAAICVPDVEEAARWYTDVLGFDLLSPPYEMAGPAMDRDMGELIAPPVVVKAAIIGCADSDHVIELIEYPRAPSGGLQSRLRPELTRVGLTHIGIVCDDIEAARTELLNRGVTFLTSGIASVAGLHTTWFTDPWDTVFILVQKDRPERPYWRQLTL